MEGGTEGKERRVRGGRFMEEKGHIIWFTLATYGPHICCFSISTVYQFIMSYIRKNICEIVRHIELKE